MNRIINTLNLSTIIFAQLSICCVAFSLNRSYRMRVNSFNDLNSPNGSPMPSNGAGVTLHKRSSQEKTSNPDSNVNTNFWSSITNAFPGFGEALNNFGTLGLFGGCVCQHHNDNKTEEIFVDNPIEYDYISPYTNYRSDSKSKTGINTSTPPPVTSGSTTTKRNSAKSHSDSKVPLLTHGIPSTSTPPPTDDGIFDKGDKLNIGRNTRSTDTNLLTAANLRKFTEVQDASPLHTDLYLKKTSDFSMRDDDDDRLSYTDRSTTIGSKSIKSEDLSEIGSEESDEDRKYFHSKNPTKIVSSGSSALSRARSFASGCGSTLNKNAVAACRSVSKMVICTKRNKPKKNKKKVTFSENTVVRHIDKNGRVKDDTWDFETYESERESSRAQFRAKFRSSMISTRAVHHGRNKGSMNINSRGDIDYNLDTVTDTDFDHSEEENVPVYDSVLPRQTVVSTRKFSGTSHPTPMFSSHAEKPKHEIKGASPYMQSLYAQNGGKIPCRASFGRSS